MSTVAQAIGGAMVHSILWLQRSMELVNFSARIASAASTVCYDCKMTLDGMYSGPVAWRTYSPLYGGKRKKKKKIKKKLTNF